MIYRLWVHFLVLDMSKRAVVWCLIFAFSANSHSWDRKDGEIDGINTMLIILFQPFIYIVYSSIQTSCVKWLTRPTTITRVSRSTNVRWFFVRPNAMRLIQRSVGSADGLQSCAVQLLRTPPEGIPLKASET